MELKGKNMSHFAKVESRKVTQVIVAEQSFIDTLPDSTDWIQTSYNTYGGKHPDGRPLRKNYAGIGYTYDKAKDAFISPKPYKTWTLNNDTCLWEPPVPYPADGKLYNWSDDLVNWVKAPDITA